MIILCKISFLIHDNITECNILNNKTIRKLSTMATEALNNLSTVGTRCRHEKPVCRSSFLKSSQESGKWLIVSKQRHHLLISSLRWVTARCCFQTVWDSSEQRTKERSCFCKQIYMKKSHSHFGHRRYRGKLNRSTSRKTKIVTLKVIKKFLYAGLKSARNILLNVIPSLSRTRPDLQVWI